MNFKKMSKAMLSITLAGTLSACDIVPGGGHGWQGGGIAAAPPPSSPPPPPAPPADPPLTPAGAILATAAAVVIGAVIAGASRNSGGGGTAPPSDIRLKRDIHLLATLDNGMKIYSFKYLWSDTAYVGVMAQDLLANPAWRNAVITSPNGFYAVNYSALGLKMIALEEWKARGIAAVESGKRLSVTKEPKALHPAL